MNMNILHIEDLGDGNIHVKWQSGDHAPVLSKQPFRFENPITDKDRDQIRWYLEEYIQFPYGAEEWKARQVVARMDEIGVELFHRVFPEVNGMSPCPHELYDEAVKAGLENTELCVVSCNPAFLAIQWELMKDPAVGMGYLTHLMKGFSRRIKDSDLPVCSPVHDGEPFRILLVIARLPNDNVTIGSVSRHVLDAVRNIRHRIELDVLRPPTFGAMRKALKNKRYHLVHFDGHGGFRRLQDEQGIGFLNFELADNSAKNMVEADTLKDSLMACDVPVFVLNACKSAETEPDNAFSSVATNLLATGARCVVAMSYSVFATTAGKFMGEFYQSIAAGESVSRAVANGRNAIFVNSTKKTAVGDIDFHDWIVPSLYEQTVGYAPFRGGVMEDGDGLKDFFTTVESKCVKGRYGFIGRDYDVLRLERILRNDTQPWILLCGMGGIGKTELAKGFGRWYAETGGCPGGVYFINFVERNSLAAIIGSISGYGTDFSRYDQDTQYSMIINYLRENRCLLIWDNFETVGGYPTVKESPVSSDERRKIAGFLRDLGGGLSRVIITSRKPDESWVGVAYQRLEISSLSVVDAVEMANEVLAGINKTPDEYINDADYGRLIKLLAGHPKSLEVTLPLLRGRSPGDVLLELQTAMGSAALEDASLTVAFEHMSEKAKRHLPLLGLFEGHVIDFILHIFTERIDATATVYKELFGEDISRDDWKMVLKEAANCGFLQPSPGGSIFYIPPTIPVFLRRVLAENIGKDGLENLYLALIDLYSRFGSSFLAQSQQARSEAKMILMFEEANFLNALRIAMEKEVWLNAHGIIQFLEILYDTYGKAHEISPLRKSLLEKIGGEVAPDAEKEKEKAALWMFLMGADANDLLDQRRFQEAESMFRKVINFILTTEGSEDYEKRLATGYHLLGNVARQQYKYAEAEGWYKKALETRESQGLEQEAGDAYYQLGLIAKEQQKYAEAEGWFHEAREIRERLSLENDMANIYHQLGALAQDQRKYPEAKEWYKKALAIRERLELTSDTARLYHQMGILEQEKGNYAEADEWYKRGLEIFGKLSLKFEMAAAYFQLGTTALLQRDYAKSEEWFKCALEIREQLGVKNEIAVSCHQLGMLAHLNDKYEEARDWYEKTLEIYDLINYPPLKIKTLAALGRLYLDKKEYKISLCYIADFLTICKKFAPQQEATVQPFLNNIYTAVGEEEFRNLWRAAIPDMEPPIELLQKSYQQESEK